MAAFIPCRPGCPAARKNKVVASLLTRDLVFATAVGDSLEYRLTADGYAAVGRECELPAPLAPDPEIEAAVAAVEAEWAPGQAEPDPQTAVERKPRTRENSKQATVIAMLQRPEGATIAQICAFTGWLRPHRARLPSPARFKKKLGLTITSEKDPRQRTRLSRGLTTNEADDAPFHPPNFRLDQTHDPHALPANDADRVLRRESLCRTAVARRCPGT
jgi:hypothetical protein